MYHAGIGFAYGHCRDCASPPAAPHDDSRRPRHYADSSDWDPDPYSDDFAYGGGDGYGPDPAGWG